VPLRHQSRYSPSCGGRIFASVSAGGTSKRFIAAAGGLAPIWEFVEELIRHGLVGESETQRRLAAFAVMDPAALSVAGGDRLLPRPIRAVGAP